MFSTCLFTPIPLSVRSCLSPPVYALFLSFFATGLALLGRSRLVWLWLLSGVPAWMGGLAIWLLLLPVEASEASFERFHLACRIELTLLAIFLLVGVGVSVCGWVRYVRWYRTDQRATQPPESV